MILITYTVGDKWCEETAKNVYKNFYRTLVNILPMEDAEFQAQLVKHHLLPLNLKDRVSAKPTRRDKAMYFLDNAISNYLESEVDLTPLIELLEVMSISGNKQLEKVATEIKHKWAPFISSQVRLEKKSC